MLTDDPDLAMTAPQALTRWQEKAGHHLRGYIIGARVDVALRPEGADQDIAADPRDAVLLRASTPTSSARPRLAAQSS